MDDRPRNCFGPEDTGEFSHIDVGDNNPATEDANIQDLYCDTLTIGSGALVNTITTIMNTTSDYKLPTEKAVVDYVASHGGGGGVVVPLDLTGTDAYQLRLLYDPTHTTAFGTDASGNFSLTASGGLIQTSSTDVFKVLNNTVSSSKITGCATFAGGLGVSGTSYLGPTYIYAAANPQFYINYDATNWTTFFTSSAGNLSVKASGGTIQTDAFDQFKVLKNTAATDKTTGSMVVTGGLGVGAASFMDKLTLINTGGSQLTVGYDTTHRFIVDVNSAGNATLYASSGSLQTDTTNAFKVLGTAEYTDPLTSGALQVSGGAYIAKKLGVQGNLYSNGILYANGGCMVKAAGIQQLMVGTNNSIAVTLGSDASGNAYLMSDLGTSIRCGSGTPQLKLSCDNGTHNGSFEEDNAGNLIITSDKIVLNSVDVSGPTLYRSIDMTAFPISGIVGVTYTNYSTNLYNWTFPGNADSSFIVNGSLPDEFINGSTLEIQYSYCPTTGAGGAIRWYCDWVVYQDTNIMNGTLSNSDTVVETIPNAAGAFRTATVASRLVSASSHPNICMKIKRAGTDGADTYADAIRLIAIRVRYAYKMGTS
jgi:hypothetical protein